MFLAWCSIHFHFFSSSYDTFLVYFLCHKAWIISLSFQMSKLVNGDQAQSLGLVNATAKAEELVATGCCWALDIYKYRKPWIASLYRTDKLEPLAEARLIFKFARLNAQKQAPNLTHPLVCIDVIEEGVVSGPRFGLWKVLLLLGFLLKLITWLPYIMVYPFSGLPGVRSFTGTSTVKHLQEFGSLLFCSTWNLKGLEKYKIAFYFTDQI